MVWMVYTCRYMCMVCMCKLTHIHTCEQGRLRCRLTTCIFLCAMTMNTEANRKLSVVMYA